MERCRVCLDVSELKMYPLEGCIVNCDVSVSEMITYCTSVGIEPIDGWPTSVCIPCFKTVRIAYNFIRQFKKTNEGLLDGTIQLEASQEVTLKHEHEIAITEDQDNGLKEEQQIHQAEACGKEQLYYEYELSDGNELEAGDEEGSGSLGQDDDIYYDNDRNFHQLGDEDTTQDNINYFQQNHEHMDSPQEDTENCVIEEFIFSKQDSEECEIEYEVVDAGNSNGTLQDDTLDKDIVYEVTNNPEQKVIQVICRQDPSNMNQPTKLRRKIKIRISCPICPNVFFSSYERELVPHMIRHEEQEFPCNVCNTDAVYDSDKFLSHFHQIHRYQCPFCGKSFARKQNLNTHMKGHSGVTYRCSFEGCDKTFPAAWNLKKHQTTHSGKTIHICPECGMEFKTYDTYRYHRKKHSGRKFLCTHCGQAFMQSVHLKYHMWTHTGIKNFKCDLCEKSYTSVTQLKKHRRRHHPKAKEFNKYEEIVEGT